MGFTALTSGLDLISLTLLGMQLQPDWLSAAAEQKHAHALAERSPFFSTDVKWPDGTVKWAYGIAISIPRPV